MFFEMHYFFFSCIFHDTQLFMEFCQVIWVGNVLLPGSDVWKGLAKCRPLICKMSLSVVSLVVTKLFQYACGLLDLIHVHLVLGK